MSSIINGFIIISLFFTCLYFLGLLTFITDHEENKCEMTFMFEYPQYVKISSNFDVNFPKYALYAYSEGRLTERARNMHFDGIPVVFIPGNGGSHKQVRSLASIALRKFINSRVPYHFDYFTIDLNAELNGLNGAVLTEQMNFVNHSIYRVLDLYKISKNPPKSVILFAHSMGGVIARSLVSRLPQTSTLIPLVLTLATPHLRPPIMLDSYSHDFYKKINLTRTKQMNSVFISLSGGYSDFLVPSFLTEMENDSNNLHIVTTQIPRSWRAADHLCILWCKQTILAINRAFFDSVDPKTRQISRDHNFIKEVFHHHLVQHSGTSSRMRGNYALKANIKNEGEWIERLPRQYTVTLSQGVRHPQFYMIKIYEHAQQHESLTVVALNVKTIDWAFVCGAHTPRGNGRVCDEFTHLTQYSEISPSAKYKRRTLSVNMHKLVKQNPDYTHVVVRILPTDEPVVLHVDVYNTKARSQVVNLPFLLSFKKHILIDQTPEKAIHYELDLPQLEMLIQSYQLYIEPLKCSNEFKHATASLIVPWANHNQHKLYVDNDYTPFHVRLYSPKPKGSSRDARVVLSLDPNCQYRVSIKSSFVGVLGQFARFYSPLLIANTAAVILMALHCQMKNIAADRRCSLFFVAVKEGAKPYYILTAVKLLSRLFSVKPVTDAIGAPDWLILSREGTDFFILPLLLYVISVGVVWALSICLCVSLVVFETTVHRMTLKFLARTVSFTVSWSDYFMSALHKLPCVVAGTLVCLAVSTTGSLALCVGMVFYFLRLTQLSQDYIEELVWYYVKKLGRKLKRKNSITEAQGDQLEEKKDPRKDENKALAAHNAIFFHATLFLVWALLTLINIPAVLTWAHNFKFSTSLNPDPAFLPGLVLSLCALPLWQLDLPRVGKKYYKEVGVAISGLAVLSLIFAPVSVFRLNYSLPFVFVVVIAHQLFGPDREDAGESEGDEGHISYATVKTKLE